MQHPNPLYLEPSSTICTSQGSCEEIKPFSFTGMQSSRKIITNTRSRITHFLRMVASLGAKQYERSSRRFQGCYMSTSTTGYDTDLGCTSSTQYIWTHLPGWTYFFFPTTTMSRVSKLKNRTAFQIYCRSIVTINLHHDVNRE